MSLEFELTAAEKITMLLDGELSHTEVGDVFFSVAQDEKLQQDFISELQIRKLMKPAAVIPPDRLRMGIISTLGLGGSLGFWANFGETSKLVASSKAFLMLLATFAGAAGTFLYMKNDMNNAQNQTNFANQAPAQNNVQSVSNANGSYSAMSQLENQSANNFNGNSSNRNNNHRNNLPPVSRSIEIEPAQEAANTLPIAITENNNNKLEAKIEKQVEPITQPTITNAMQNSAMPQTAPIQAMNQNEIIPNMNLLKSRYANDDSRFMVTFRGFATQNSGNVNLAPESSPSINNVAIGTMYEFTKNFSAGFEFGQENFVQQFKATSTNSEIDLIQNKLAFWGGVNMSYKMDKISSLANLQPYGSLFLGGTNFGYITRQSLGLNYEINSQFAMFTGLEYTSLFSSYNAIWSTSQKYGMTYGIQLKF